MQRQTILWIAFAVVCFGLAVAGGRRIVHSVQIAERAACIDNLRRIDSAKNQWAMWTIEATNSSAFRSHAREDVLAAIFTDPITNIVPRVDEIQVYLGGDMMMPSCPGGGKYTMGKIGQTPKCSVSGHSLEP